MSTLRARLTRLERLAASRRTDPRTLAAIRTDPAAVFTRAGMTPDPWQRDLLRGSWTRALAVTGRQNGKSTTAAGCCIPPLTHPGALVLIVSPTLRQSVETYRKAVALYDRLGRPIPVRRLNATFLELANGARLIALPGDEKTIRGFSDPALVVVDEAARTPDAILTAVRPMLGVSGGKLLAVSTPWGARGWFHREWTEGDWHRVRVTSADCPRLTPGFLDDERRALGDVWFRQEHLCSFEADVNAVFAREDILAAGVDEPPLLHTAA